MTYNNFPQDEQSEYKKKNIGAAKRIIILAELCLIAAINGAISLVIFLMLGLGTSVYGRFFGGDFSPKSFPLRGEIFIDSCLFFLIIFGITGIMYALAFVRIQLLCKNAGEELEGAFEVNNAAYESSLNEHKSAAPAAGPIEVACNYLKHNGIEVPSHKPYAVIKNLIVVIQIILAIISFVLWMKMR